MTVVDSSRPSLGHRVMDVLRPAATAVRPAALRLAIGAYSARHQFRRRLMLRRIHAQSAERFAPVGPCRILRQPLAPAVADRIYDVGQVVNLLATLGVAHRVTGPLNAALHVWTMSYRNSWGMILHNDNMLVLHQTVLGTTRSADALSVDALLQGRGLSPQGFDRRYGAVPVAMNAAASAIYVISGVAKIRSELGVKWAGGDVLRGQIAIDGLRKDLFGSQKPATGVALYPRKDLFTLMATGALAVELGAPLSLLHPRVGQAFALAAWGMHWGIRVVMDIRFPYNTSGFSYVGYVPIGRALRA
ncbi:MAG: hypothetical protein Q4G34_09485 [Micrococcus sp.]|nr:hypothetical protein [Micrococcus sp.]